VREGLSEYRGVRRAPVGILALWDFAPVPFFRAFEGETEATRLAWVEDHLRAAEER
jgi:hypothetical protein